MHYRIITNTYLLSSTYYLFLGLFFLQAIFFLPLGLSFNDSFWVGPFEEWTTLKAWNGNPVEPDQSIDF